MKEIVSDTNISAITAPDVDHGGRTRGSSRAARTRYGAGENSAP
nr:hypothetical protein [Kibdelosporangium sp. MJ126-NF4]CTQ99054.1 hypothetical protein [Kibdelosporangium sp. MJ126-NF4]